MMHLRAGERLGASETRGSKRFLLFQASAENHDVVFAVSKGGKAERHDVMRREKLKTRDVIEPGAVGQHNRAGLDFLRMDTQVSRCRSGRRCGSST